MSVREYIGARYVPLFMGNWDNTNTYEPLSIVQYQGNSYTSKQYVPAGIDISNTAYWASTGNYNAQIEQYRQEVYAYNARITANEDNIEDILSDNWVTEDRIDDGAVTSDKIEDGAITNFKLENNAVTNNKIANNTITGSKIADNTIDDNNIKYAKTEMIIIGDSWSTTGYDVAQDKLWWYLFAIKHNLIPHNYAISGSGYMSSTGNFSSQIDSAIADNSFNHNKVKYIFIFGSLNDKAAYNADEVYALNTIKATVNKAKTNFPRAQVICIGPQNPINADSIINRMTQTMRTNISSEGYTFIPMEWVTLGLSNMTNPDRLYHPTVAGQKEIAGYIENYLNGNHLVRDRNFSATDITGCTLSAAELQLRNNNLILRVTGHSNSSTNGTFKFSNNVLAAFDGFATPVIGLNTQGVATFLAVTNTEITIHDTNQYAANNYYGVLLQTI